MYSFYTLLYISKRKSEKNDLKKAEKKEKRKPIPSGLWSGLVKVFDSKICFLGGLYFNSNF
ncbi:MAG: hypothetical protein COA32_05435 [Fluviicola sp.]|nr:MAG: hypothetical protein COA32_05435 [Fluviicola sp.]